MTKFWRLFHTENRRLSDDDDDAVAMSNGNDKKSKVALIASQEVLESYSDDVEHLWCPKRIPLLEEPPSPSAFFRNHVSKSIPCIIRNAIKKHNGDDYLSLTLDDLCDFDDNVMLTVDVTPDGLGDCVRTVTSENGTATKKRMFVKPQEQKMNIIEFRDRLRRRRKEERGNRIETDESGRAIYSLVHSDERYCNSTDNEPEASCEGEEVLYYSRQNDCLRTEVQSLFDLFPETIPFAQEALGDIAPDAINLWIGNEQVVSSMHKDHYENLFYVSSGEKVFTLCPPADAPFLYQREFETGTFCRNENREWIVRQDYENSEEEDEAKVPSRVHWIEGDVEPLVNNPTAFREDQPLLSLAHPIRVHVKAGEMLYLPALWFHRVTQTTETVGVNYWFDMQFDSPGWCYFNLLQQLQATQERKQKIENEGT